MSNTEIRGVSPLNLLIARTDYLIPEIKQGDRELSWDGFIYAYHHAGDNHSKDDLMGRIPIQVKGHKCKNIETERKSYSTEISDMRNYLQEGGTIFFVIFMTDDIEEIYYCTLLPYELKLILKDYGNQKTRTIDLKPFPTDKKEISRLIMNIIRDRDLQRAAIMSEIVTLEDIEKSGLTHTVSFGCMTINENSSDPLEYIINHGTYLYVDIAYGISLPVQHIENVSVSIMKQENVYVGNRLFYNCYYVLNDKDYLTFGFGKSIKISIPKKQGYQGKIEYNSKGTLSERIIDAEFMISVIKNGNITIKGTPFFDFLKVNDISAYENHLEQLIKVQKLLQLLNVKKELDFDSITEHDEKKLAKLVFAIVDQNLVPLNDTQELFGMFKISNVKLLVCAIKDYDSGLYKIYDALLSPIKFKGIDIEGNEYDSSLCLALGVDWLINYDNVDYDIVLQKLSEVPYSVRYCEQLTIFLLQVLKLYDSLNLPNHPLLSLSKRIITLIKEKFTGNEPISNTLNALQITRRERELTVKEIAILEIIISDPTNKTKYNILTGTYLLLDNQEQAQQSYLRMTESEQREFDSFPINRFRNWR